MSHYITYYDQYGAGEVDEYRRIGRVYIGAPYQRGHGIGAFLGGLFRKALPFISSGAKAIGKEALRAGFNILSDGGRGIPLKEAAERRLTEAGLNLKRRAEEKISNLMKGSGYKSTAKRLNGNQSRKRRQTGQTSPVRKAKKRKSKTRVKNQKKKTKRLKKKNTKRGKKRQSSKKKKKTSSVRSVHDIFGPV